METQPNDNADFVQFSKEGVEVCEMLQNKSDLSELSKDELVAKVQRLQTSNDNLRRQVRNLNKNLANTSHTKAGQKQFQFDKYSQQKIALKLAYIGWDYQGFAVQDNTNKTIEQELFSALKKTHLIKDRASCQYSRCGRTDKGVSAFGQVIALNVR